MPGEVLLRNRGRDQHPHCARRDVLPEIEPAQAGIQRAKPRLQMHRGRRHGLPIFVGRIPRMRVLRPRINLHLGRAEAGDQKPEPAQGYRTRPHQHEPLRILGAHHMGAISGSIPDVVPGFPPALDAVIEAVRSLGRPADGRERLAGWVGKPPGQHVSTHHDALVVSVVGLRRMGEPQGARFRARRKNPQSRLAGVHHFVGSGFPVLDPRSRQPLGIVVELARIGGFRCQHAHLDVSRHENCPHGDAGQQSHAQVAPPGNLGISKTKPSGRGQVVLGPYPKLG